MIDNLLISHERRVQKGGRVEESRSGLAHLNFMQNCERWLYCSDNAAWFSSKMWCRGWSHRCFKQSSEENPRWNCKSHEVSNSLKLNSSKTMVICPQLAHSSKSELSVLSGGSINEAIGQFRLYSCVNWAYYCIIIKNCLDTVLGQHRWEARFHGFPIVRLHFRTSLARV